MELLSAREEIRIRMDYNRHLLAGQVTLVAALIAGGLTLSSKDFSVGSVMLQATAAVVLWLNTAFVFENTANNSHVSLPALGGSHAFFACFFWRRSPHHTDSASAVAGSISMFVVSVISSGIPSCNAFLRNVFQETLPSSYPASCR